MCLILHLIDEHRPFEALNIWKDCDKKDYGKIVERVAKWCKPYETTTIGIVNSTRRLLDEIRDLGIKLPRATARVEEGERKNKKKENRLLSCIVTALALSRSMASVVKDKDHQAREFKMVKKVSFR